MSLSYKLCKKLRDAGFPQPHSNDPGNYSDFDKLECFKSAKEKLLENEIYCPTLSELIQACQRTYEGFLRLEEDINYWEASVCECEDQEEGGYLMQRIETASGEYPEEAVANLWFALNKKKL